MTDSILLHKQNEEVIKSEIESRLNSYILERPTTEDEMHSLNKLIN